MTKKGKNSQSSENSQFLMLSNNVVEALARFHMNGQSMQLYFLILRKTTGWSKKWDAVSLSQIVDGTGMDRSHACHAIRRLIGLNMIFKRKNPRLRIAEYRLNMDFETWRPLPKKKRENARSAKKLPIKKQEKKDLQNGITQEPAGKPATTMPTQKRAVLDNRDQPVPAPIKNNVKDEIMVLARQIYGLNGSKKFNVNRWVGKHFKRNSHPGAILKTLVSIRGNWNGIKNVEAYAERIISIESGNFFEKDAINTAAGLKEAEPAWIGNLFSELARRKSMASGP